MAWLFAFLVFLLCYIPNIGSIIATLLPMPVAVTQFHDPVDDRGGDRHSRRDPH